MESSHIDRPTLGNDPSRQIVFPNIQSNHIHGHTARNNGQARPAGMCISLDKRFFCLEHGREPRLKLEVLTLKCTRPVLGIDLNLMNKFDVTGSHIDWYIMLGDLTADVCNMSLLHQCRATKRRIFDRVQHVRLVVIRIACADHA